MDEIRRYLLDALSLFALDPADSDYRRGYEAAIKELLRVVEGLRE